MTSWCYKIYLGIGVCPNLRFLLDEKYATESVMNRALCRNNKKRSSKSQLVSSVFSGDNSKRSKVLKGYDKGFRHASTII